MDKFSSNKSHIFIFPCPSHPGEQIIRACNDFTCSHQCIYCPLCEKSDKQHSSEHRTKIRPISEVIIQLSNEIEKYSKEDKTSNSFLIEESEKNIKFIGKHLKDQRNKMEQDFKMLIENIVHLLKQNLNEILTNMDKQYDIFVRNYEIFKASFSKTSTYNPLQSYSNVNTLVSKLKSIRSIKEKNELLLEIKKYVNEKHIVHSSFKTNNDHKSSEFFKIEELLKNQLKNPPTYNTPGFESLSKKIQSFSHKLQKIFENHIFFYPLKSALTFMAFRNLKLPKEPIVINFEMINNNKGVVLELENLDDIIQLNPTNPMETNHDKQIQNIVALSNEIIATGGSDNLIKIWDLTTKKCLKNLYGNTNYITSLSLFHLKPNVRSLPVIRDFRKKFSEYDFLLLNGSFDKNLVIWDSDFDKSTVNTTKFKIVRGHDYYITCMQELYNGENLISGDEKGFIIIWNILENKSVFKSVTNKFSHRRAITSITLIDKIKIFVTSDIGGIILVWEIMYQKNLKRSIETILDCKIVQVVKENHGGITNMVSRVYCPNVFISSHDTGKLVVWKFNEEFTKIKSNILIEDIQDSIHQIAIIELKEKPKSFVIFCLLSQKHGICVVDSDGKITATIKFGGDEELISSSLNPNHKFQFVGISKPLLAIVNQSREKKNINFLEIY